MNLFEKLIKPKPKKEDERWTCAECGQTNAKHRLACNDCGKDREPK
jgi:hypothetical protein